MQDRPSGIPAKQERDDKQEGLVDVLFQRELQEDDGKEPPYAEEQRQHQGSGFAHRAQEYHEVVEKSGAEADAAGCADQKVQVPHALIVKKGWEIGFFLFFGGFFRLLDMRKQKAAHAQGNDAKGHRRRWMEMYEAIDAGRKDETSANDGNDAAVRYRYEAMEPGEKHHGRPRPRNDEDKDAEGAVFLLGEQGERKE